MIEEKKFGDSSRLLSCVPSWLNDDEDMVNAVLGSRIKLVRNLEGYLFPHKASRDNLYEILYKINGIILSSPLKDEFEYIDFQDIDMIDMAVLNERGLLSQSYFDTHKVPGGMWITKNQDKLIGINNDNHIRIVFFDRYKNLMRLKREAFRIDKLLKQNLKYMKTEELKYLTTSPLNTGTGCKFNILICLPGLSYHDETYRKVKKLMNKRNISFISVMEDPDTLFESEFFLISNKTTLNIEIDKIIENLQFVIDRIQGYLQNALEYFFSEDKNFIEDKIYEAAARFKYCKYMEYDEFLEKFSYIILAKKYNYLNLPENFNLKSLLILLKSNNIEYTYHEINPEDVDIKRAEILREIFKNAV